MNRGAERKGSTANANYLIFNFIFVFIVSIFWCIFCFVCRVGGGGGGGVCFGFPFCSSTNGTCALKSSHHDDDDNHDQDDDDDDYNSDDAVNDDDDD
ncbi:GH17874 [Drosophila grimshawi]|uniref:GH17874 n=1 Tax=Drosophila grimshawi TaxID=7222 RepID=B4JX30_DROGR|nr:GH17874 [Drosophila grimshawi]